MKDPSNLERTTVTAIIVTTVITCPCLGEPLNSREVSLYAILAMIAFPGAQIALLTYAYRLAFRSSASRRRTKQLGVATSILLIIRTGLAIRYIHSSIQADPAGTMLVLYPTIVFPSALLAVMILINELVLRRNE